MPRGDPFRLAGQNLRTGQRDPRIKWRNIARPDQLPPEGDWRTWLITGGRGSGKTRTGAQTLADWILTDPEPGEWGIVAPTYRDAWTVCVEGDGGILTALDTTMAEIKENKSRLVKHAWRSHGEIILHDGNVIRIDSANDGALRVQGHNLKGCWCDELGLWMKWETAWDESVQFAVRQGISRIIATGTPKVSRPAAALIRRLLRENDVVSTRMRTMDNLANLSQSFYDSVVSRNAGTRLEKQELEGLLLEDVEGALWTRDLLDAIQVDALPSGVTLTTTYVGVDPSDGTKNSDEQAYAVIGKGSDGQLYVVESYGERISPVAFLRKAVQAAIRWDASIVLEKNHGGAYLVETLYQVMRDMKVTVAYRLVNASHNKRTRAEPVAALYERGIVRHVHWASKDQDNFTTRDESLVEVEDQMATFTGAQHERSPDRLDSLVWAATPFLRHTFETQAIKGGVRRYDVQRALDEQEREIAGYWAGRQRQRTGLHRSHPGFAMDGEPDDSLLERMGGRAGDKPERPNVHVYR